MTNIADAVEQQESIETASRMASVQADNRRLRRELAKAYDEHGKLLDLRDTIVATTATIAPPAKARTIKPRTSRPSAAMVALISDLHTGEVVSAAQTDSWGMFNYAIAERRLSVYGERMIRWLETQRHGYNVDTLYVVCLGDMVSGDIHEELSRSAEFPSPVQAVAAGRLLAGWVSEQSAHYKRVVVHAIGGSNHGRLTVKPQSKDGTLNSYDYITYEYARALLLKHKNVTVNHYASKKQLVEINGYQFLCEHGDSVKAWMGIPWYGTERSMSREARRRLAKIMEDLRRDVEPSGGYDYLLSGHWHTPFIGPSGKLIVNGSVSGTSEYDHQAGRHSEPYQVTFMLGKHGVFAPVFWRLDTAEESALVDVDSTANLFGEKEVVL